MLKPSNTIANGTNPTAAIAHVKQSNLSCSYVTLPLCHLNIWTGKLIQTANQAK